MTLTISLADIVLDPEREQELPTGDESAILTTIKPYFGFLGPDVGIVIKGDALHLTLSEVTGYEQDRAQRSFERGVRLAERGQYDRAVRLFREALDTLPLHTDARRNLAMAYLESGDPEKARELLVQTLRLDPKDAWAYLLLGNIAIRQGNNMDRAGRFYEKAVGLSPDDHIIITNYAALLAERGEIERADALFLKAIQLEPTYPNAYYALAKMAYDEGDAQRTINVLDNMFDLATGPNVRNQLLFDEVRGLYLDACTSAAEVAYEKLMVLIEDRALELDTMTGYPIELVQDESLQVPATTRIGWKYGEDHHVLRYRGADQAVTPHLLMHELEHIAMEAEARDVGLNLMFTATSASDRTANEAIADHAEKLRRDGTSATFVDRWNAQTIHIIRSQLYNIPLDMVIEQRLLEKYESLRPSQFASLHKMQAEALETLTEEHIRKNTAPVIYRATVSLNYAFALCIDHLFGDRTNYGAPYKREGAAVNGSRVYNLWRKAMRKYQPGDQYPLVDDVASLLGLSGWYAWQEDRVAPEATTSMREIEEPEVPEGVTNEELLAAKHQAAVMFCLDALERFEGMPHDRILKIASEIAMMGSGGLDYASAETKYHVTAYEDESFSGLQMMCMMYVGFQKVDPSIDLQMPLDDAYREALELYRNRAS